MDKLPVLWLKLGTRGGSNVRLGMSAPILAHPNETSDASEYIPARRCRTCARFRHPASHMPPIGYCHSVRDELEKVPPDGSGFCHNYEEKNS